jgi:alanyl aminopeptidase
VGWSRRRALELDRLASARRVRNPVQEKNDLFGAFDAITYNKGAAVLSMFEARFTPERFRDGVRRFLKRHAWGTATSADFFRALGEASGGGRATLEIFRAFIQQPGVPLIDVALDCNKGLELSQQRLRPVGSQAAEVHWTTPACFRVGAQTQCADIGNGAQAVALEGASCPAWLLANPGGRSYYVPRYEASLARELRAHAAELSPNEMVAHAVDAEVLSVSGLLSASEALAWADAALAHPAPMPRQFGLDLAHKQRDAWLNPAEAAAKRELIARRVRPLAAELGWREREGESDEVRELRASVLPYAATFVPEEEKLRAQARELALAWLANREALPATLTRAVLETAARFADEPTYAALEQALLTTQDLRDRQYLVSALARVRDDKLLARALALTLKSEVSGNTADEFLQGALGDEFSRDAAFEFVRANFDALVAKLPQHSMSWHIGQLGEFCTRPQREQFAGFFKDRAKDFQGGPRQYRQSLERIDLCIAAHAQS